MNTRHLLCLLLSITPVTLLAAGCDKNLGGTPGAASVSRASSASLATPPATAMPSVVASASASLPARPHLRRGGVAEMFLATASEMRTLKPEQITKIEALYAELGGVPSEATVFHSELAAEVRAGKIDTAKLAPLAEALDTSLERRAGKAATALSALHDMLAPAERMALTEAIRVAQKAHEAQHADLEEWRKNKVGRLTRELDLDAAQQKRVESLLARGAPRLVNIDKMKGVHAKRREALLTAFEGDSFNPKKYELRSAEWDHRIIPAGTTLQIVNGQPVFPKIAYSIEEHEVSFLGHILPILRPDQLVKLAKQMDRPHVYGGDGWGSRRTPVDVLEDE